MPAPGEQHLNLGGRTIINPFEEVRPRVSEYTAQEIATLQSRLEKQLGPEYISSRAGPSGQKVHYLAAEKCIQLANEVFGFNGWSSQIMDVQVDFVDEHPQTLKITLGLSVIVRVTLKDGTFHEDIGYGHIENCKGKAAAFEKAKKEGTTDALKRALKNFGNVLGNCIYDKEYLAKVTKIKVEKPRWDVANLHRHSDHMPIKKEQQPEGQKVGEKEGKGADGANRSELSGDAINVEADDAAATEDMLEDEFGDFDEADFSVPDPDSHPDEIVLPAPREASHNSNNIRNGNNTSRPAPNRPPPNHDRPPVNHQPPMRPPNGVPNSNGANIPQPQTPNSRFTRSTSGAGQATRPPQDAPRPPQPNQPIVAGRVLNQPSRTGPPSAPVSPSRLNKPSSSDDSDSTNVQLQGPGFFSARAAAMVPESATGDPLPPSHISNLPAFNPHLESPSIRKTPGIDHKSSKPLTKDLKHVPGSSQAMAPGPGGVAGMGRGNVMNPQMDAARRIGVPGAGLPSPLQNRGSYKPPTMKRPIDSGGGGNANRAPLGDLPANGPIGAGDGGGGDVKRQRLNG